MWYDLLIIGVNDMNKNLNGRYFISIERIIKEHGYGKFKNGELIDYETSEEIDEIERCDDTIKIIN
jgi:hypothetical protein